MPNLAIINRNTNICENVTSDPRPIEEIVLPEPYFVVDITTTHAIDWVWDETLNDWVSVEGVGNGGIGDVWDGEKLMQPHP